MSPDYWISRCSSRPQRVLSAASQRWPGRVKSGDPIRSLLIPCSDDVSWWSQFQLWSIVMTRMNNPSGNHQRASATMTARKYVRWWNRQTFTEGIMIEICASCRMNFTKQRSPYIIVRIPSCHPRGNLGSRSRTHYRGSSRRQRTEWMDQAMLP
jgi:hypothetical protein